MPPKPIVCTMHRSSEPGPMRWHSSPSALAPRVRVLKGLPKVLAWPALALALVLAGSLQNVLPIPGRNPVGGVPHVPV